MPLEVFQLLHERALLMGASYQPDTLLTTGGAPRRTSPAPSSPPGAPRAATRDADRPASQEVPHPESPALLLLPLPARRVRPPKMPLPPPAIPRRALRPTGRRRAPACRPLRSNPRCRADSPLLPTAGVSRVPPAPP